MTYEEIDLPLGFTLARAAQAIEDGATLLGLRVSLRGTLGIHPGCIHWHLKRGKEAGTLEVTLLNPERRIVLSVRENRMGVWTEPALEALAQSLQTATAAGLP